MKKILNSLSENEKENFYVEELNFYIDSTSNIKESLDNTDKSSEIKNNLNNYELIPKSKDKNNKMVNNKKNSKYNYIKALEQKIYQQEKQISQLIDYKNLCEETIKEMNPLISLPLRSDINYNINKYNNINYLSNKNRKNSKKLNLSYSQNRIKKINKGNIPNRANSE